jgi:hypothetical protein
MFEGTKYDVVNDEAQIDQDDEGDEKVDENGHLLGGREYRVRTFTIEGRGEKLYMLSTEPARCCGFRDSYLFFTKHPKLYKVLVNDAEKKDLIEREVLPSSYKGRNIGVVVARSVFREFGARIIVGGRRIIDDYKVSQARADGFIEGELADPDDAVPGKDEQYNRNRYVAWFGASEVYRNTGGAGAPGGGKPAPIGSKRRNNITLGNWQTMHANDARYVQILSEVNECTLIFPQPFQHHHGSESQNNSRRRIRPSHKHDVLPENHATNARQMGTSPATNPAGINTSPRKRHRPHQRRLRLGPNVPRPFTATTNPLRTHNLHPGPPSRLTKLRRNRHSLHSSTHHLRRLPRPRRQHHRPHRRLTRSKPNSARPARRAARRLQAGVRKRQGCGGGVEEAVGRRGRQLSARWIEDRL